MWAPILLFVFVGLTAAQSGWEVGKEYSYKIDGRTLTGIHQVKDQYAGILVRGKLIVKSEQEGVITLQVRETEYADVNHELSNGWATNIPEEELEYRSLQFQNSPFQLFMKNGLVQKMVVEDNLPPSEVNFLKAIASQFQLDIHANNLKKSKWNDIPTGEQENGVFKTNEDSVNGIYETLYEVYPMPDYILQSMPELVPLPHLRGNGKIYNIQKSRNFSKSEQHMVYRYGMSGHEGWSAGSSQMGNMLARTSGSRTVITGDLNKYTIQYAETTEKVLVAPHLSNSQKGIAVSRMTVVLQSVDSSQSQSPAISNPREVNSLVYEYQQGEPINSDRNGESKTESKNGPSSSKIGKLEMENKRTSQSTEWIDAEELTKNFIRTEMKRYKSSKSSDSSSSEEYSPISSKEEFLSPRPKLNGYPYVEFLPDNIAAIQTEKDKIIEKIESVSRQIGQYVSNPNNIVEQNALTYFSILSRLVSSANSQQLNQAVEKLYYNPNTNRGSGSEERYYDLHKHQAWVAFRDALSVAGTGPALVTLNNMIKSGKVKGEEAAALISVIPASARYPTTEYMNYFFEMVKSIEVESQRFLNTSAIIAFSDLVRRSQVDPLTSQHRYPVHLNEENHRAVVTENYIPYLQMKLKSAMDQSDSVKSQVYIQALGSMAHKQILAVYEPYLEGKYPTSSFQRLVMVASLSEMTRVYPELVRAVLYRIYQNYGEATEVRVAAVMQLMKTNPPSQMLQRMAEQTNYDTSKHVNAAVKTAIQTAAKGELTEDAEVVQNARSAVNFLTPENYGAQYCRNFIRSFIAREQSTLQNQYHISSIHGLDGGLPSSIFYSLHRKIGGYLRDPEIVSIMTSSSEELTNLIFGQLQQGNYQPSKSNEGRSSDYTYQKLSNILQVQYEPQKQVEGNILFSMFGMKRYFTFDNHTIEQLPKILHQFQQTVQNGVNFHHTKYYNQDTVEVGFPLAMGMRFTYSYSAPSFQYFGIKGNGKFEQQKPSENNQSPMNLEFNGRYHYLQTNQRRAKLSFVFGQQRYTAGFERVAHAYIPLEGKLQFIGNQNLFQASLKPLSENNNLQKLFQYRTNVYTTHNNVNDIKPYIEGSNVKLVQPTRMFQHQKAYGKEQTGYAFQVDVQSEKNFQNIYNTIKGLNYLPTDFLNLMTHLDDTVSNNHYTISYNPEESTVQDIVISLSYKTNEYESGSSPKNNMRKSDTKHPRSRPKIYEESRNLAEPLGMLPENRMEELMDNVVTGIQNPKAQVLDASISFGGNQNTGKYSLTIAHSESPVSENSRYLLYYKGIPVFESQNTKSSQIAVEANIKKPFFSTVNYRDAISANPKMEVEGKIHFGKGRNSQINFQGNMMRSEHRKQHVENHPLSALCLEQMQQGYYLQHACRNSTLEAGFLDKYEFSIEYKNVPEQMKKAAYALYGIGRHVGFQYNTENIVDVKNSQGQLSLGVQLSEDLRYLNMSIEAPYLTSRFENIRINGIMPFMVQHPRYSQLYLVSQLMHSHTQGVCSLDTATTTTFNNKTYPANLGNCYHVLAMYSPQISQEKQKGKHDYSKEYDYSRNYFAILAKEEDSHKKVLKVIIGDDVVTMEPSGANGVKVIYNGESVAISEKNVAQWKSGSHQLHAYTQPGTNNVVLMSANHGIQVTYDGHRAQILMPNSYRSKVRGLCGTFDGEPVNDFTSPRNCILKNYQQFTASYAVADSTCQGPAKDLHQQVQSAPCDPKYIILGDVVSDKEAGRGNRKEVNEITPKPSSNAGGGCTTRRVYTTKKEDGMICFSIKPQVACNPKCNPASTIEKTVEFHCLSDSSATRHWLIKVNSGANPDFSQKKANHQEYLKVPEKCVPSS